MKNTGNNFQQMRRDFQTNRWSENHKLYIQKVFKEQRESTMKEKEEQLSEQLRVHKHLLWTNNYQRERIEKMEYEIIELQDQINDLTKTKDIEEIQIKPKPMKKKC